MRPFSRLLFTLLLVVGLSDPSWAGGERTAANLAKCTLTLSPEIDCPSCEEGIKHVLVTAHGVQSAEIDVLTNKVVVRYNPAIIKVPALIGRIAVTGYTAREGK